MEGEDLPQGINDGFKQLTYPGSKTLSLSEMLDTRLAATLLMSMDQRKDRKEIERSFEILGRRTLEIVVERDVQGKIQNLKTRTLKSHIVEKFERWIAKTCADVSMYHWF